MGSGGARNRSGPPADPTSGRSARRGLTFNSLPAEGRKGRAPAFPLPILRFYVESEDGQVENKPATTAFRQRELEVWREHWHLPQACAWEREPWRWETVAELCRLKTVVERNPDANAALVGQLHRYRDQVGLTPAGLRENGWVIQPDEVAAQRAEKAPEAKPAAPPVRRLRAVPGGQ